MIRSSDRVDRVNDCSRHEAHERHDVAYRELVRHWSFEWLVGASLALQICTTPVDCSDVRRYMHPGAYNAYYNSRWILTISSLGFLHSILRTLMCIYLPTWMIDHVQSAN